MARAIQQRWPISQEQRGQIVARLLDVLNDPEASRREFLAASKALIAAEAQNQKDDHAPRIPAPEGTNRFEQVAIKLGIPLNRLTNGQ